MIDCISIRYSVWSGRTSLERLLIITSLVMFILSISLIISLAVIDKKLSDAKTSPTPEDETTVSLDYTTSSPESNNYSTAENPNNGTSENPNNGTSENTNNGTSENPNNGTSENPNNGTSENPNNQ
ncbi:uncharacterized protein DDB_G0287625-like [Centruroides sculpturatus]|uniref:uncharacterized protein DDB_G0287625-like n=1 Tax=Centruroides sculpturatus TaxID=218467 RepID=UPI000C6CE339|nr:uncharacterized protein DDB_G0287625-like [Centruroides sculpturatus]XP_023237303.1 uncharacterized protein DDB_G0287625-like [Centruroides sculpturatus]